MFELITTDNAALSQVESFVSLSKDHKSAGLTKAGQRLELEAAFEICNSLNVPIYKREILNYQPYKYISLLISEFFSIEDYPQRVPNDVIEKLSGIKTDYYEALFIADLTKLPDQREVFVQMRGVGNYIEKTLAIVEEEDDPVLLYKFDYKEYYMELARW